MKNMKNKFLIMIFLLLGITSLSHSISNSPCRSLHLLEGCFPQLQASLPSSVDSLQEWVDSDSLHLFDAQDFYRMHYELQKITAWVAGQPNVIKHVWREFLASLGSKTVYYNKQQKPFLLNPEPILTLLEDKENEKIFFEVLQSNSMTFMQDLNDMMYLFDLAFDIPEEDREECLENLKLSMNSHIWVIGRSTSSRQIIVTASLEPTLRTVQFLDGSIKDLDLWQLANVAVHPNILGTHAAKELMQCIEKMLNINYVFLKVWPDNFPAINLYLGEGYSPRPVLREEDFSPKCMTRNYIDPGNTFILLD